ncbi:hypothetical protein A5819_003540 [Enterococcus sp. 7E2_DIV0204]|uniref:hypothetical protein n=1 Tax=unclassified Enterococcus TaxID=2608891 RepID=UPI000A33CAD4|nr:MULTISPECIES: hypothetical protein [unclassified Enterococcus]OTN83990.1 hypothetical protein A5819_003540 [Enterococcus sp. 7E2_DIV0204]OTP47227.1 hypothetical protein A5884_003602 [Enterococcus sp. 7D2_DIV0200]
MTKKTKKEFFDYNEYRDRGMGYKWDTAFALGELQEGIKESTKESRRDLERLPQQEINYIEYCLERSIKHNKILEVQLNSLDQLGRVKESIWGNFRGFADLDVLMIGDQYIDYADVRHIKIHDFRKWSETESGSLPSPFEKNEYKDMEQEEQEKLEEVFNEYFEDDEWIE